MQNDSLETVIDLFLFFMSLLVFIFFITIIMKNFLVVYALGFIVSFVILFIHWYKSQIKVKRDLLFGALFSLLSWVAVILELFFVYKNTSN